MTITIYIQETFDHIPQPYNFDEEQLKAMAQTLVNGIVRGDYSKLIILRGEPRNEWARRTIENNFYR